MSKNPTMAQILEDTRRLVGTKLAAAKSAEITGQAPSSMPGAEHDKPVDPSTKSPDPETRDGTMVPNSGLSTAGAGDDSPQTRGHALEADEAADTPTKKPAVTADANAKTAGDGTADLANEILGLVRSAQKTAAAAAPTPAQPAAPAPQKAAAAPAPAVDNTTVAPAAEKEGGMLNMELTTDVMAKIAALVLSTDEGAAMASGILEKAAGAEAARDTMAFLAEQADLAEKAAAYEAGVADAEAAIQQQIFEAGIKQGAAQMMQHPLFKLGQDAADASMGGLPPEAMGGLPPEAMGGLPPEAGGEAGDEAGGDEDVTEDDIIGALQMLVDDGTITPEVAQQVVDAVAGGEADGAADAGAEGVPVPEAGAAEGVGEGEAEPEKEAAARASKLLAVIKQLQAK